MNGLIESSLRSLGGPPRRFVLAVSGGPDSQCLLKAFPHVAAGFGHSCVAIGVDHGLRDSAGQELALAETLAASVGVEFRRIRLSVGHGPNLMSRARDARYSALLLAADAVGASEVVTAHHADDRAETVLIRLVRGDRVGSLAVLPEVSGRVYRPLLRASRAELEAYVARWGVPFATDPSNSNPRFLRSRVRHELLPLLEELNPSIKDRLNSIADELLGI